MKNLVFAFVLLFSLAGNAQINQEHLEVGEKAPLISGVDQFGKDINSEAILKDSKILLLFYRGNWCPYCKKHLKKLQKNLESLTKKGYYVVVVTPEKSEKVAKTTKDVKANFSILHDIDNKIMNAYKVAFEVNDVTVPKYLNIIKKKLAEHNVEKNNVLPVPATYIIGKDGKISYVHYDPDYTKRASIDEILEM